MFKVYKFISQSIACHYSLQTIPQCNANISIEELYSFQWWHSQKDTNHHKDIKQPQNSYTSITTWSFRLCSFWVFFSRWVLFLWRRVWGLLHWTIKFLWMILYCNNIGNWVVLESCIFCCCAQISLPVLNQLPFTQEVKFIQSFIPWIYPWVLTQVVIGRWVWLTDILFANSWVMLTLAANVRGDKRRSIWSISWILERLKNDQSICLSPALCAHVGNWTLANLMLSYCC